jgi:hypothetical protein
MDTNVSLNWWLKTNIHHKLVVQYDSFRTLYIASLAGVDAPSITGFGPNAAAAICNLNVFVAALRLPIQ